MREVTIRQLQRAKAETIQSWLPFLLMSDGKAIATVVTVALARPFSREQQLGQKEGYESQAH